MQITLQERQALLKNNNAAIKKMKEMLGYKDLRDVKTRTTKANELMTIYKRGTEEEEIVINKNLGDLNYKKHKELEAMKTKLQNLQLFQHNLTQLTNGYGDGFGINNMYSESLKLKEGEMDSIDEVRRSRKENRGAKHFERNIGAKKKGLREDIADGTLPKYKLNQLNVKQLEIAKKVELRKAMERIEAKYDEVKGGQ